MTNPNSSTLTPVPVLTLEQKAGCMEELIDVLNHTVAYLVGTNGPEEYSPAVQALNMMDQFEMTAELVGMENLKLYRKTMAKLQAQVDLEGIVAKAKARLGKAQAELDKMVAMKG